MQNLEHVDPLEPPQSPQEERESDEIEEQKHFQKVLMAFAYYRRHSLIMNNRRRYDYMLLSEQHKALVPHLLHKINHVDGLIEENTKILKEIVRGSGIFSDGDLRDSVSKTNTQKPPVSANDMDKVRSTLKQFVRDWSKEGEAERQASYAPILNELENIYSNVPIEERGKLRVLVPGAGLGRLAFEICKRGFSCQGNEFSFYMLLSSNFILNRVEEPEQFTIYPFVHSFSNIRGSDQQLSPIRIPDVLPSSIPPTADFSMVAGDFIEVYGDGTKNQGQWDVVATCFFIDTAKNIIQYLEIIHKILKPGGTWINLGPLLYHFENTPGENSIELTLDDVRDVAQKIGFTITVSQARQNLSLENTIRILIMIYHRMKRRSRPHIRPTQTPC
ncbi:hypothetical protein NQZ79_g6274 [Umbelopsis isabellina]|nr:hypothetical protein NQZ79_g6274 [Umbelopsis isabellina]